MDLNTLRPVLLLLCLPGVCRAGDLLPSGPLEVRVGGTGTFSTLMKDPSFTAIAWYFSDGTTVATVTTPWPQSPTTIQNVNGKYAGRASIDANGALTLSDLTEGDSGKYSVSVTDRLGNTQRAETELRVIVPVSDVWVVLNTFTVTPNVTAILNCSAKGNFLSFRWFSGSTRIIPDGERVTVDKEENTETLTFSPLYRDEMKEPTYCEVYNTFSSGRSGNRSTTFSFDPELVFISPEAPPAFVDSQSNFRLTCSADALPGANFSWYHDNTELETTGPVLTLTDIQRQGLGKTRAFYNCKATNDTNEPPIPSRLVTFTIAEKLSEVTLSSPGGKLFAGNSSVNLSCSVTEGSPLTVKWMKDGAALSSGGRVVIAPDMKSVRMEPLQKDDSGEYACQVSNGLSMKEAKVNLTVYFGPEPVVLRGVSVGVPDQVRLVCSAPSLPPAKYTWKFNGSSTTVTTNYYVVPEKSENTGTYTCEARNSESGRTSSADVFLSVKDGGVSARATVEITIIISFISSLIFLH